MPLSRQHNHRVCAFLLVGRLFYAKFFISILCSSSNQSHLLLPISFTYKYLGMPHTSIAAVCMRSWRLAAPHPLRLLRRLLTSSESAAHSHSSACPSLGLCGCKTLHSILRSAATPLTACAARVRFDYFCHWRTFSISCLLLLLFCIDVVVLVIYYFCYM